MLLFAFEIIIFQPYSVVSAGRGVLSLKQLCAEFIRNPIHRFRADMYRLPPDVCNDNSNKKHVIIRRHARSRAPTHMQAGIHAHTHTRTQTHHAAAFVIGDNVIHADILTYVPQGSTLHKHVCDFTCVYTHA